ncbi:hypothetical protein ZWY2020_052683 [Hordeum vulgare]|nr:hypothetical protein ZWY2020_052683 [Hordeum vulgare]
MTANDLLELVEHGMIANKSWRLPAEGETEPAPTEGERVLLLSHVFRGFSLPAHPFFRGIMNHFGAQLHHFPPNAIAHLVAFVTLCECFIGCPPHWGLFKYVFFARSQTVKKLSQSDDKTHLLQLCGGLGFQKKTNSSYRPLQLSESVRNWQSTLFCCQDIACPNAATGLPPFSLDRPAPPRQLALSKVEKVQIQPLVDALIAVVRKGVTGTDLLETFLGRRIQPLQARHHAMWHYVGPEDSTRTHPECVTGETVTAWVRGITRACDNPQGARRVRPFRADNPPPNEEWTNWHSAVSNGNPAEEEEGSQEGSVHSAEYVSESGETEEETEEEEDKVGEQSSPPPPPEHRSDSSRGRDQRGSGPALAPVLEVVPSAVAPTTAVLPTETMPPTETVPLAAEPTAAELGMPKESSAAPGPSTVQYDARHLPEDQVGAAKDAMVQVELMAGDAKGAYDSIASLYKRSLELRTTCEMGSAYNALKAEKIQLAAELEAAVNDLAGVKGALADREKSLEETRETNKALVAEIEKMGRQRTEWMGQLKLMNNRCMAQEKYVNDWARKMIALLGDFCLDAEAEAAEIERSVVLNVPLGDEANRDMLRAHIHLGRVGPFIGRLREVIGRIDKELWPEDDSRQEIEGLMTRLEDVPNRVQAWKKSAARCGADVALSLVRVHCKEAREEKLKELQVADTKKLRFEDFMGTFLDTATRIADGIDLDTFVEPASPGDT